MRPGAVGRMEVSFLPGEAGLKDGRLCREDFPKLELKSLQPVRLIKLAEAFRSRSTASKTLTSSPVSRESGQGSPERQCLLNFLPCSALPSPHPPLSCSPASKDDLPACPPAFTPQGAHICLMSLSLLLYLLSPATDTKSTGGCD